MKRFTQKLKGLMKKPSKRRGKVSAGYQDNRFPMEQYNLIYSVIEGKNAGNLLEVGTNQGRLLEMLSKNGFFCVGLDITNHYHNPLTEVSSTAKPALGVFPVDVSSVNKLPVFDCVACLSVHHQWVKNDGDEVAQTLVRQLCCKASSHFFIEFAGIAEKYGYSKGENFEDNLEESVVSYARKWLENAGIRNVKFLGKTREFPPKEPYRFLFVVENHLS